MTAIDDDISTLTHQIELACLIEATARKPGNVHPGASFHDLTYHDFVTAARIAAPKLARARELGVGHAVRDAVEATILETGTNVNLGICLLIAPLAAVPGNRPLRTGILPVLKQLSIDDAKLVYEAIRLAKPGGLGDAPEQDVRDEPTQTLLEVMQLAADRDGIAAEYARDFRLSCLAAFAWTKKFLHEFQHAALPWPQLDGVPFTDWEMATIGMQLSLMMVQSDTLIRRKCGDTVFHEAACRAEFVMKAGHVMNANGLAALSTFDGWLRADGHRRNPGTTADLIAAIWFVALREQYVSPPSKEEIVAHAALIRDAGII